MPTKKNDPNQNPNHSQSGLEDDIKAPTMDPPRKPGDADIEGDDRGRVGRRDGGGLEQRDEDVPTRQGDDVGDEADEADEANNDAGYDGGAKSQPR
jgi:hypothetical protein